MSLGGLEFLDGIPGSVGGAIRMNAGAMGCATFEVVTQVRFMDRNGNVETRGAAEVPVEYEAIPNTTHFLQIERPDECVRSMEAFLTRQGFIE